MSSTSEPALLIGHSTAESSGSSVVMMDTPQTPDLFEGVSPTNNPESDPPVIIGMSCRLPGNIGSPSDLWDFIVSQKSAQGPVPAQRYNIDAFYHPNGGNRSGLTNVPGGYFLNGDIRSFDNTFFGISNLEATYMDPQQRSLLEVAYECVEDAGVSMQNLSGSTTGVFVGNFSVDYQPMMLRDPDYLHRYIASGSGATIMSNRISHIFNLHGPSFTVDTACSSSLYALHQAVNAIKTGDCDSAIVASANMVMTPEAHIAAAKSGVLSPTGTCHTFDISADGYGRAEAVNAIYVKRLSAALRDGNPIRAVIRGSAVNASGRTAGISLPSGDQQEVVMRKAYQNAGLDVTGTDYVECHGTGTPVGDPIEVDAVGRTFSRREGKPLLIGSVKTNIGHSEGASGLTSILKVVKSFEHGLIPPSYGIVKLNPKLKLEERNLKVALKVEEWPRSLRRASINSFGYGGANAHLILESAESYLSQQLLPNPQESLDDAEDSQQLMVLPVSAATPATCDTRLKQISQTVTKWKRNERTNLLRRLAHTLTTGRDHLRHRKFLLVRQETDGNIRLVESSNEAAFAPKINRLPFGFVFTGQGAQYAGMAKELLVQSQHFRNTIRKLDVVLKSLPAATAPSWTLEQTILDAQGASRINEVTRSQPICTAVQIGLVDLLRSWGVQPTSVVGHSSGEIGAAYAAGLLTYSQAILVAYYRGFAVGKLTSKGTMMAAGLSDKVAKTLIADNGLGTQVRVACVNSPESVTLSGSADGIETLKLELQSQSKFARALETGGRAYHSHMMEEIGELYESLLRPLFEESGYQACPSAASSRVTMYSSVGHSHTGMEVGVTDFAAYWRRNLEQPVQFSAALTNLLEAMEGNIHLIEVGPHAALKGPIQQIRTAAGFTKDSTPYSPTLVRNQDADISVKLLCGTLYTYGHDLTWTSINGLAKSGLRALYDLPTYPWDYSNGLLWSEPRISIEMRNRIHARHELLGTPALTGSGIDFTWRNVLKPNEMPWIKDHRLEDQVLFPAAGYLAMAIEAVSQATASKGKPDISFQLRDVNITAALNVPLSGNNTVKDLELHTTMTRRKASTGQASSQWYDFSISSWVDGQTALHCTGSIRVSQARTKIVGYDTTAENSGDLEEGPAGRWYTKWHQEGMCFGPNFQSLTKLRTDRARVRRHLRGTVALHPAGIDRDDTYYPVHPITIDACLQAAAWSTVAGNLPDLKAWLPVFISECTIQPAQTASESEDTEINAYSKEAGPSSIVTKGVLRDARGTPIVEIQGTRMSLYSGNSQASTGEFDKYMERQPTLRVLWKPDVLRLSRECEVPLVQYVAEFIEKQPADIRDDQSMAAIGALLDLAGHKNPRMRVLELGGDCVGYKAQHWKGVLDGETAFSRCKSWSTGEIDENGTPVIPDGSEEPYDVLVIPKHATSEQIWAQTPPEQIAALVSDHGIAIFRKSAAARDVWESASFEVLDVGKEVLLAIRPVQKQVLHDRRVIIVQSESPSPIVKDFGNTLATYLQKKAGVSSVIISTLGSVDLFDKQTIVISLLELEREFLATMSPQDMDDLRAATDVVADLLWLTGANMLGSQPDPNLTLSSGLSRALMLEQPALRFSVMDVGSLRQEKMLDTSANVIKALVARYDRDDCEYIEKNSMLCISRYTPDFGVNSLFRRRVEQQPASQKQTLASAGRAQLSIRRPGGTDTLHFQQQTSQRSETLPPPAYVDIQVRALSLSASDVSAMIAGTNSAIAIDFSGVVTAVGPDVEHLKQGDRVVACVPHQFGTIVRVPARSVHPMLDHESFTVVPTMLSAYSAALHAINDKAHIRARESVLVHPGPSAIGIAAIVLALSTGAIVYTTAETEGERQLHQDLGVPQSHIFSLQEASFTVGIMEATDGRGVNAVLNVSLVGDAMQESWRCLTAFGRFVELGERELQGAGKLDMSVFLRNASFSAVKLTQLFYATDEFHRDRFDELVASTLKLYRAGKIQPPPTKEFDVSQLSEAYRHFSGKEWMGNIVICMENPRSRVLVAPAKYATTFDPEKVYLLVGCLGGLGRSLSRWMMSRGARHFVFLGRSGTDKPSAQTLVSNLEKVGATVGVVRGDVSVAADVNASVLACLATGRQIGGVIQAAMGLHEALFTRMPHKGWHTGIQPKWAGTWNLHNALEGHDLDFFLLTSSVSGTVGTATESNYCSANGFLDAFARWRRSQGKPAVSVGLGMISEVGYLHENPEIEALLLRKGIQPLTEEDMIQLVDLALASKPLELEEAHLLTGLEPAGIRALTAQGFDVTNHGVLVEARASVLLASLFAAEGKSGGKDQQAEAVAAAAPWFKELPSALTTALAAEADAETMHLAIIRLVKKRFSNLILMPFDQIDETRSLPDFGVDSMIASEFRTWFWSTFKIDVPFLDLMSAQKSLKGLAAFVEEKFNTSKP
ncbi:polyketide synthase [Xylaria sp. CBS 124048]|nr:polyketide synthase [Xylaria sp. CBS 124048]